MNERGTNIRDKSAKWITQKKKVYDFLYAKPQTRLEVSARTNTPIQNVCRYVGQFRKEGKLLVIRKDRCSISKMMAEVITTNTTNNQLTFFG